MSHFTGRLLVEPVGDGVHWRVWRAFKYHSDRLGQEVTIPAGFDTDGASVPRLFWGILSPTGPYFIIAIIHDWLYRWQGCRRREADAVLLEGMWVLRCRVWQYLVIWAAVRLCGWWAWWQDKKTPLEEWELPRKNAKDEKV